MDVDDAKKYCEEINNEEMISDEAPHLYEETLFDSTELAFPSIWFGTKRITTITISYTISYDVPIDERFALITCCSLTKNASYSNCVIT